MSPHRARAPQPPINDALSSAMDRKVLEEQVKRMILQSLFANPAQAGQ